MINTIKQKQTIDTKQTTMYLNNYTHVRNFLEKYPNVDIADLDHISDTLHYGKLLQGKTLQDIQEITAEKKLYSFASALQVPLYAQKKKQVLKAKIIDKYNQVFGMTASMPDEPEAVVVLPTLTPLDERLVQSSLSIGKPQEFDIMEHVDLEHFTSTYPIETMWIKDRKVLTKSSILDFLKFTMHELFRNKYRNLKYYMLQRTILPILPQYKMAIDR